MNVQKTARTGALSGNWQFPDKQRNRGITKGSGGALSGNWPISLKASKGKGFRLVWKFWKLDGNCNFQTAAKLGDCLEIDPPPYKGGLISSHQMLMIFGRSIHNNRSSTYAWALTRRARRSRTTSTAAAGNWSPSRNKGNAPTCTRVREYNRPLVAEPPERIARLRMHARVNRKIK